MTIVVKSTKILEYGKLYVFSNYTISYLHNINIPKQKQTLMCFIMHVFRALLKRIHSVTMMYALTQAICTFNLK